LKELGSRQVSFKTDYKVRWPHC